MNDLESLKNRKKELQAQQEQVDKLIEEAKLKKESELESEKRSKLTGLFNRMDSLIKTCGSSFSEESIGDIHELAHDLNCAKPDMRTIEVEISGRMIEFGEAYDIPLSRLRNASRSDCPTLVVSFLIPFDMIDSDEFFSSKLLQ